MVAFYSISISLLKNDKKKYDQGFTFIKSGGLQVFAVRKLYLCYNIYISLGEGPMGLSNEIKIVQRDFMTQTEFAEALHVSFTTVNRWDAGKARPNLSAMKEIK